jgi:hypothetical protein
MCIRDSPWRGLILVLAGALVGSGATTAAFANSLVKDSSLTAGGQASPGAVVVAGSGASDSPGAGGESVTVTTDGSGKIHIEYQWDKHLRELSRQQLVITEPTTLDLSGHPADARSAWVSIGCRDKGGIEVGSGSDRVSVQVLEADGHDKASGGPAVAMMVALDESPKQIRPTGGCVADVTVTYFAEG